MRALARPTLVWHIGVRRLAFPLAFVVTVGDSALVREALLPNAALGLRLGDLGVAHERCCGAVVAIGARGGAMAAT